MDINVSIETLKNHLADHDATAPAPQQQQENERKKIVLETLKQISEYFSPHHPSTTRFQDVRQYLSPCIQLMLKAMGDASTDIRLSADDHLKKVIKSRIDEHSDKILVVLFKSMKFNNKLCQRAAIQHFASVCHHIRPQKCRTFVEFLLEQFKTMFKDGEPLILIMLADAIENILSVLGFYFEEKECKDLVDTVLPLLSNDSVEVRRGASQCIGHICRYITKCPINDICLSIYDIALSTMKEDENHKIECIGRDCLQGCIQTFSHLLDVFDAFSQRSSRATASHYSLNQLFANLVCDLLLQSLSINDQKALTASFSLLGRLLNILGNYCKNWRKEKIHDLTKKLFHIAKNHALVTVRSSALEAVERFLYIFPDTTIRSFQDNGVSIHYLLNLSYHEDYLLRGRSAILIGALIRTCIDNYIYLTRIPTAFETEYSTESKFQFEKDRSYSHLELLHIMVMHMIDMTQMETNSLCLKMMCTACAECLPKCLSVPEFAHNVPQLLHTFVTIDDSFWGVRAEILTLLLSFDYTLLEFYERKRTTKTGEQKSILLSRSITQILVEEVLWKYIFDDNYRVREHACATFLKILPHLNGIQEDRSSNNRYFIERHTSEYESRLLKQTISDTTRKLDTSYNSITIRDHELENIVVVLKRCVTELNLISNDKNKLSGLLELMGTIAKSYGTYDENSPYYINTKKAISSVGHAIFSHFSFEILHKMLDIIHFSEISNDLNLHGVIVETVGIYCLELAHVQGSTQPITTSILQYLMFLLEVISDLDVRPNAMWNEKEYTYAKKMSDFVFEKLYTNIQRSLRASAGNLENLDSISVLRGKILRSLYFLMLGGHQQTIVDSSLSIIALLQTQVAKDKVNTILCAQELFAILFSQQNNYYSIDTTTQQYPRIENCIKLSVFDELFSNFMLEKTSGPFAGFDQFQRVRTSSLLIPNRQPVMTLSHTSKALTVQGVLEMFEPIVADVIDSFKSTHSHRLQNLTLFMLTRMVCANVDFKRLDKDSSLLKHILKLINEMQSFLSDHDPSETLYQIMDFLSVLIFIVRYGCKELDDGIVLATISSGLESTQWSTSVLLRSLSPLVIRSYLYAIRNPATKIKGSEELENYGKRLLEIFLNHIKFPECLSVLTLVLRNVAKDHATWKKLSSSICDKLVKDCKFDLEVNWFDVQEEMTKILGLLDALFVDKDTEEPSQVAYCRRVYTILQTDVIPTLESHSRLGTPSTPDNLSAAHFGEIQTGNESQLNRVLDANLLKALMIMRFLNNMKYLSSDSGKQRDMFAQFMEVVKHSLEHYTASKVSVVQQMEIYLAKIMDEVCKLSSHMLTSDVSSVNFISEQIEHLIPYFNHLTDEAYPYRMSVPIYSALIAIFVKTATKDSTLRMRVLSILAQQFRKTTSAHYDTHSNAIYKKMVFLPMCYLMSCHADKGIVLEFLEQNEFIRSSTTFWSQVLVDIKEPVVRKFVNKFTSDFELLEADLERKKELTSGLTQFVQNRVDECSTRHMHLNRLRKLVKFVEELPPLQSILDVFVKALKDAEHLPLFFHKKIYKNVINTISLKDSLMETPELETVVLTTPKNENSLDSSKQQVLSEIENCSTDNAIQQDENIVAKFLARFRPFSEQSPMKYAPISIASMTPSSQKTVIELSKKSNSDINRLSDAINRLTTVPQLETFFSFFYEKIQAELKNHDKQHFSVFSSLATDIIKLIDKHVELSEIHDLNASFYCSTAYKCFIMQFYCKLIELFYVDVIEENAVDTADVDVLLSVSISLIEFVEYNESDTELREDWDKFIIHMSKLLIDMTTVDSKSKLIFLKGNETVEKLVRKIISRTYVIQQDDKSRQFGIGNLIPFVSIKHLAVIRKAAIHICQHYPSLAYGRFLSSSDDMPPRIDDVHIHLLNVMINEISCNEVTFKAIWDLCFDLLKCMCEMPSFDEMQLSTLKLLTNMLCLVRFSSQPQVKKGAAIQQKIKQYGKALYQLLETVGKFLLKNTKHKMKEKRQFIVIDEVYARAIFKQYMLLVDNALRDHKKRNPELVKEMLKSLTLIMSRSPTLFLSIEPNAYTFQWVYDTFKAAYTESVQNEDWLVRQYVVLGLSKSYSVLYNQEEASNAELFKMRQSSGASQVMKNQSGFILSVLQDAMSDPHTRLCAHLSVLIFIQHRTTKLVSDFLPFLSENFQRWFLEESQTVHAVKLQIRMITSIIESYPDASTHNITRKVMEALFSVADNSRTPLAIICAVYEALEHLLANYALSHFERKLIEALTSMQQSTKQKQRAKPNSSEFSGRMSVDKPPVVPTQKKSFLGLPGFHVRNLSGSTFTNFTSSIGMKKLDITNAAKSLVPSTSQDDLRGASNGLSNAMSRSFSTPDISYSIAEPIPLNRKNSLSKLPVLFYSGAPAQQMNIPLAIVGPPPALPKVIPTPNTSSSSLFGSLSPNKQAQAAPANDHIVTRVLHKTEAKTMARNSHTRKVLLLGLMVTSMYTAGTKQSEEKREHVRVNVLQLFDQLHDSEMHREAEVLLKFIPQLLEDFFDPEQILPLIYNEYVKKLHHPLLFSHLLRTHIPPAYSKASKNFGDWIQMGLDSLPLKRPISLSLWGLLNLFICVCLCDTPGAHHQASFVELGSVVPLTPYDGLFSHAFLLYGVCFYSFLKSKLPAQVPGYKNTLTQLLQYTDDKQPREEIDAWKQLVISLRELMETLDEK